MRRIQLNIRLAVFTLVFLGIFVSLGSWQLDRATEKEQLLKTAARQQDAAPVTADDLSRNLADGTAVQLNGRYDESRLMLLDNRTLDGTVGFEVLVPFVLDDNTVVLVNRGFVAMNRTRDVLPEFPAASGSVINGTIYHARENQFIEQQPVSCVTQPCIIQLADPQLLTAVLGESVFPHVVRLAADDPFALPRYWPIANMTAAKHRGYALQWFTMAAVLLGIFVYFTFRNQDDRP